jgi:hypothetical protein
VDDDGWMDEFLGRGSVSHVDSWAFLSFFLSFIPLSLGCVSAPNTRSLHHHGLREVVWARDSWCLKGRFRLR